MADKSENEIPRDIRAMYQKGQDALLRENYDYAIEIFTMVLDKEPTFHACRKALQTARAHKSGGGRG